MSDRLLLFRWKGGGERLTCAVCVNDHHHSPHIGHTDRRGLWVYCRACHAPRVWEWPEISVTLTNYWGASATVALPEDRHS